LPVQSEHVSITVDGKAIFSVTSLRTGPGGKADVHWRRRADPRGVPAVTRLPIMAMPVSCSVPTPIVSSGAVDHSAGKIPGFAQAASSAPTVPVAAGLGSWIAGRTRPNPPRVESATAMRRCRECARRRPPRRRRRSRGLGAPACGRSRTGGSRRAAGRRHRARGRGDHRPGVGFNVRAVQQGQPYATTGGGPLADHPGQLRAARRASTRSCSRVRPTPARPWRSTGARAGFSPWTTLTTAALPQVHGQRRPVATPGGRCSASRGPELLHARGNRSSRTPSRCRPDGRPPGLAAGR